MGKLRIGLPVIVRRRKLDNSRVKAVLLPEEILDRIYHLLLTRARFGSWIEVDVGRYSPHFGYKHAALKDLASVLLVCRAWYPRATAALYTDVAFNSVHKFVQFADTLVARPHIARFVRLVKLPPDTMRISLLEPSALYQRVPGPKNNPTRWLDVRAAVNRILAQCTNVEEVFFCGGQPQLEDIASLLRESQSLARLTCCTIYTSRARSYDVDIVSATQQLGHLQALTLSRYIVETSTPHVMHALPALHTLRMHACMISCDWLTALLSSLANLRVMDWNGSSLSPLGPDEAMLPDILCPRRQNLVSCTAIDCTGTSFRGLRITLSGMDQFTSLRTLSIVDTMLRDFATPPPCLVELTILMARSWRRLSTPEQASRKSILDTAQWLRSRIPSWREHRSPSLREIYLWDRVDSAALRNWAIAACLLKAYLAALDVDFVANLKLSHNLVEGFQRKFGRHENSRLHRWKKALHLG